MDEQLSVVIPFYHNGSFLEDALNSLRAQEGPFEFICVNDGSADDSSSIVERFVQEDPRFRLIEMEEHRGRGAARKRGVSASQGKWIAFMDADGQYLPGALSYMLRRAEEEQTDILHFSMEIRCANEERQNKAESPRKTDKPFWGKIKKRGKGSLLQEMVINKRWNTALWSRIFRREICVQAFTAHEDIQITSADDLYASTLIHYFAGSYCGDAGKPCYLYEGERFGNSQESDEQLSPFCGSSAVVRALRRFEGKIEDRAERESFRTIVNAIEQRLCGDDVIRWSGFSDQKRKDAFEILCENWTFETALGNLANLYHYNCNEAPVKDLPYLDRKPREIRTVGIYYLWLKPGGVQRVMIYMSQIYQRLGYRVLMLTDQAEEPGDFPLPEGVERVVVPDFSVREYSARVREKAKAWAEVIRQYHIDVIDYNRWNNGTVLWDFLAIRRAGAAVIHHFHSLSIFSLRSLDDGPLRVRAAAGIADAVAVLSRVDLCFIRDANPNTMYIPNPPGDKIGEQKIAEKRGYRVLWCGRLSGEKDPLSALRVFYLVHRKIPEASLTIVGGANEDTCIEESLREEISRLGLTDCVEMTGMVQDTKSYYLRSDVFINTSKYEGFPMAFVEAAQHGLPIVTFALPYLEVVRNIPEIVSVPQGDLGQMAERVAGLLKDPEVKHRTGQAVRRGIEQYYAIDLEAQWKRLMEAVRTGGTLSAEQDDQDPQTNRILWQMMMEHYAEGYRGKRMNKSAAREETLTLSNNTKNPWKRLVDLQTPEKDTVFYSVYLYNNGRPKLSFREMSMDSESGDPSNIFESYSLPEADPDGKKHRYYRILTSKKTVTVAEGGTEASSPAEACEHLEAYHLGRTRKKWDGSMLDTLKKPGVYLVAPAEGEKMVGPAKGSCKLIVEELVEADNMKQTLISSVGETFWRVSLAGVWQPWHGAIGLGRIIRR